eukprot:TRINITY_DN542_c0_g1_i1.p2 TRINITY_DN542_c0_g1~~TRINITY_DN542_c0_g1_i1.p2  ORF type:complete len:161 (+),score=81.65 TRINITY_DN542_c0_g1_i1:54-536(+)
MPPKMTPEELEAKRAEIAAQVEEARRQQDAALKAEEKRLHDMKLKFGTHYGITCDGCEAAPVVGYRWRCTKCKNHDVCEACHEKFQQGTFVHTNRLNTISTKIEDHEFVVEAQMGGGFKPMHKEAYAKTEKRVKPNEPCTCKSGKKYKKCCGDPAKAGSN